MGHERRPLCDRASTSAIRRSDETRAALQYVAKGHKATWRAPLLFDMVDEAVGRPKAR